VKKHTLENSVDRRFLPVPYGFVPNRTVKVSYFLRGARKFFKLKLFSYFIDLEYASFFKGIFGWWYHVSQWLFGFFTSFLIIFSVVILISRDFEKVVRFLFTALKKLGILLSGFKVGALYFGVLLAALAFLLLISYILEYGNKDKKKYPGYHYRIEKGTIRTTPANYFLVPIVTALMTILFCRKTTSYLIEANNLEGLFIAKSARVHYLARKYWFKWFLKYSKLNTVTRKFKMWALLTLKRLQRFSWKLIFRGGKRLRYPKKEAYAVKKVWKFIRNRYYLMSERMKVKPVLRTIPEVTNRKLLRADIGDKLIRDMGIRVFWSFGAHARKIDIQNVTVMDIFKYYSSIKPRPVKKLHKIKRSWGKYKKKIMKYRRKQAKFGVYDATLYHGTFNEKRIMKKNINLENKKFYKTYRRLAEKPNSVRRLKKYSDFTPYLAKTSKKLIDTKLYFKMKDDYRIEKAFKAGVSENKARPRYNVLILPDSGSNWFDDRRYVENSKWYGFRGTNIFYYYKKRMAAWRERAASIAEFYHNRYWRKTNEALNRNFLSKIPYLRDYLPIRRAVLAFRSLREWLQINCFSVVLAWIRWLSGYIFSIDTVAQRSRSAEIRSKGHKARAMLLRIRFKKFMDSPEFFNFLAELGWKTKHSLLKKDFFAIKECFYSVNGDVSQFKDLVRKKVRRRLSLLGVLDSYIEGAGALANAVEAKAEKDRDFLRKLKEMPTQGREDIMRVISGNAVDVPDDWDEFEYREYLLKLDLYRDYSYFRDLSKFPKIENPWKFWENWRNKYFNIRWWEKLLFENILGLDDAPYKDEKKKARERRELNLPSASDKFVERINEFAKNRGKNNKEKDRDADVDENLRKILGVDKASLPERKKDYTKGPRFLRLLTARALASTFAGLISEERKKKQDVKLVLKELEEKRIKNFKKEVRRLTKSGSRAYEVDWKLFSKK
jgi:hypothetical protein